MRQGVAGRRSTLRVGAGTVLLTVFAALLVGAPTAFASAKLKEEFLPFVHCPLTQAKSCLVSTTTSGEFVIGHKTVKIEEPVVLQGGLGSETLLEQPLLGASGTETLSQTPLTVPGGLLGIAGLGGEVTATAELAGPPSTVVVNRLNLLSRKTPAVTLPIKVKLSNPVLGESCYIGSEAEPIVLHLTTGTTNPPPPTEPLTGSVGNREAGRAKGKIRYIEGASLVDNDFSVPGASGCGGGLSLLFDPIVDLDVGIPASPGASTAIMTGTIEETAEEYAAKYLPKEKKKKA